MFAQCYRPTRYKVERVGSTLPLSASTLPVPLHDGGILLGDRSLPFVEVNYLVYWLLNQFAIGDISHIRHWFITSIIENINKRRQRKF